jgi:hypothetical protein
LGREVVAVNEEQIERLLVALEDISESLHDLAASPSRYRAIVELGARCDAEVDDLPAVVLAALKRLQS